ncbi:hypothetical protein TBLA_0D00120 [Henningerozyma blattae CBS 6284]|uniref:Glycosyltransferase family 91 protein n=1 Tax=Henningerozyma blattae (strain ATCC 34711 / CBS 6284 / DSM 70876 / NBRC 10599 / NRRL Y-10934 / UCD 77-7) TaxID=1071380 RepID=I2H2C0_HENB6|nr:hypothetical protein TBLA_0D00120 [Tetrapisispora blattae CBS 6284]CCH60522.1 hypothetical protein TBLA_0D00120 [Tetrapisispora blattae CBS 6284]
MPSKIHQITRSIYIRRIMYFRFKFIIILLLSSIIASILILNTNDSSNINQDSLITSSWQQTTSYLGFQNKKIHSKKELSKLDLTNILLGRPINKFPIPQDDDIANYDEFKFTGFITNLNVKNLIASKKSDVNSKDLLSKDGRPVAVKDMEMMFSSYYGSIVTCEDLAYPSKVLYSSERKIISDDLVSLRQEIISKNNDLSKAVVNDNEKGRDESDIVRSNWYRFGSSSVWLEKEQCYITVTRLMYSYQGKKEGPDVSVIRAQAFDRNWNELYNKRIPKLDFKMPKNVEKELEKIDTELGLSPDFCNQLIKSPTEYDKCIIEQNNNLLKNQKTKERILDKYFVTYPTVYNIDYKLKGRFSGSEDPRIILKTGKNNEPDEPIVIFNMHDQGSRRLYGYFPHRSVDTVIKFEIQNDEMKNREKNWAPFFTDQDSSSELSRGSIHFIYTFMPLEILKCSLNDGSCNKIFSKKTLELSDKANFGGVRGGTQFVPLPSVIPRIPGKQIWLGFSKLHIDDCGCGKKFYRPMLNLLVEEKGIYHQELIGPSMDFNTEVLDWNTTSYECSFYNVMSPNSIAFWDIISQDPENGTFNDLLVFTYSEADEISKVVNIKGILDYILNVYSQKDIEEDFTPTKDLEVVLGKTLDCIRDYSYKVCANYGEAHSGDTKGK